MNFAKPILICDANEEFRGLVREMLTKNGFFHVVEVSNAAEAIHLLREKKEYFVIIHPSLLDSELTQELSHNGHFLILADNNKNETALLATKMGVKHILSFPIHSRKLMEKIQSLI